MNRLEMLFCAWFWICLMCQKPVAVFNLYRIWRTWRRMKKQTLKKVMMTSRKSKRMNCKEKTDLRHPKNQTLNWLLLRSPVSWKPIKI